MMSKVQTCSQCDTPTVRCEDDALMLGDHGPYCDGCYDSLIAAAPDMLAALEAVLRVIDLVNASDDSAEAFAEWTQAHEKMVMAARSAIKKARGEE